MKSRLAILGMLVTGMLFSTAGAGLAVSGLNKQANNNAAISQYATPVCTPDNGVSPSGNQGNGENCGTTPVCTPDSGASRPSLGGAGDCGESGVLPAEAENAPAPDRETETGVLPQEETQPATGTQPERQAEAAAETSQLPFTGFAAIPVLLGGLALLTGGLILRRRTREH